MFASYGFIHDDLLCTTMNKKHGEEYSSYTVERSRDVTINGSSALKYLCRSLKRSKIR